MAVTFENIGSDLSPEKRNGLEILKHLPEDAIVHIKELLNLGIPNVVGPETLEKFVATCSHLGLNLSDKGVNEFKNAHRLGNTGDAHGVIGNQTAEVYYQTLLVLLDRSAIGTGSFPFAKLPKVDWTHPPRSFGANRNGGTRAHAGCDLYFPEGTAIHAIADGKVVRGPYAFYAKTFALEVDHGSFLVRYGEIKKNAPVQAGDTVSRGQKIAEVGKLVGIVVPSAMLHLELYDKSAEGPLTVLDKAHSKKRSDGVSFQRRKDLIDPTPHLNIWKETLP